MKTLLEKAKEIPVKKCFRYDKATEQDLDLVIAWLNDEVSVKQICEVMGFKVKTGNYLYYFSSVLKKFYKIGKIKIKKYY